MADVKHRTALRQNRPRTTLLPLPPPGKVAGSPAAPAAPGSTPGAPAPVIIDTVIGLKPNEEPRRLRGRLGFNPVAATAIEYVPLVALLAGVVVDTVNGILR